MTSKKIILWSKLKIEFCKLCKIYLQELYIPIISIYPVDFGKFILNELMCNCDIVDIFSLFFMIVYVFRRYILAYITIQGIYCASFFAFKDL